MVEDCSQGRSGVFLGRERRTYVVAWTYPPPSYGKRLGQRNGLLRLKLNGSAVGLTIIASWSSASIFDRLDCHQLQGLPKYKIWPR